MKHIPKNKIIRDAVHENIELSRLETDVLDAPQMQRLRYVRQLSLTYLVYPSALHTRFEHSLGTMHLTKQLSTRLFEKDDAQLLCLAALLHDVGHPAFSHSPEPLLKKLIGKSHEDLGVEKIRNSEISDVLSRHGFSSSDLLKAYKGGKGGVITSDFGTDRIDYLLRDAYFTGVAYSVIDAQRLLLSVDFNGKLFLHQKGVLAAESLFVSRHLMFRAVYNHPAVRIASAMLVKALELALFAKRIGVEDITEGTDDVLLYKLRGMPLADRLLSRRLYKNAFEAKLDEKTSGKLEKALGEEFGEGECAVSFPLPDQKKFDITVLPQNGKQYSLQGASELAKALALKEPSNTIVACSKENKEKVARACKQFL